MTREEAKQLLPIIQAFAEGKPIEIGDNLGWKDLIVESPNFDCKPSCYRIKPEPKYRPFKNQEECWQEMQKHQPFGWLKDKYGKYLHILHVGNDKDFTSWFTIYKFVDGTPFGIKEE